MSGKGSVGNGTTSKVWLVTGASRGLGRAIAEAALSRGHKVVATARNPEHLKDLISEYGGQVQAVALDVTSEAAASHAVSVAIESFGRLDVLVNNAGYGDIRPIEDTSIADFRAQIETNLFGVIIVTKAALPFMRMQGAGHILQISSVGGRLGPMGRGPYAAAKWGVEGFSEVLAKEVSPLGIKITIVEPGGFRTDFAGASTSIYEGRPEYDSTVGRTARFQRDFNGKQPGDPAKAADVLVHLTSLESPPLRLLLGSDAFHAAEQNDIAKMKLDQDWRDLTFLPTSAKHKYTSIEPERGSNMTRRNFVSQGTGLLAASVVSNASTARAAAVETSLLPATTVHRIEADGVSVFYRQAGQVDAPVIFLLHGFPTSSIQYRELIPRLADRYRVIAPDLPGFGFTEVPAERGYHYSFEALAKTMLAFTDALKLKRYALYVFDYGAPTGFRLAMAHPERVTAIVSQNGNAYEEGLGSAWAPIQRY